MTAATRPLRVTVWGENWWEQNRPEVAERYPLGIHGTIQQALERLLDERAEVRSVTFDDPEHGLDQTTVDTTDVLLWWGNVLHDEVDDTVVDRVHQAVLAGLGLIVLHSGHESKLFRRLMGTTCSLRWRSEGDRQLVWTVNPSHPIARGIPHPIDIPADEMYGEHFDIPAPDELVFISSFSGGEVFRSGCTFRRGHGRIFYFSPGDQDYPVYHRQDVQQVIANAVEWVANDRPRVVPFGLHIDTNDLTRGKSFTATFDLTGPAPRELA